MSDSRISRFSAFCIKTATGGNFSHALICSYPPSLIEALPGGARKLSLSRCWVHNIEHVKVLRAESASPEALAEAGKLAEDEIGKPYSAILALFSQQRLRAGFDRLKMLFSVDELKQGMTSRKIFCSMLVAKAYAEAGISGFEYPYYKINPTDIQNNPHLTDVTREIFPKQAIYGSEYLSLMAFLDGERPFGFTEKQTLEYSKIAEALLSPAIEFVNKVSVRGLKFNPTFFGMIRLIQGCDPASLNTTDRKMFDDFDQNFFNAMRSSNILSILGELYAAENDRVHRLISDNCSSKIPSDELTQKYLATQANYKNMFKQVSLLKELNERWRSKAIEEYLRIQDYSLEYHNQQINLTRHAIEDAALGSISG